MTDNSFEELAKLFPDLFQKARIDGFECGDGWYNILGTLCSLMSHDVQQARYRIGYYSGGRAADQDKAIIAEATLAEAIKALPIIAQVKEKFGTLRFYMDGVTTDKQYNWIQFAESMSARTCENCGSPGERRSSGWIKTLCESCDREFHPEEYQLEPESSKRIPKLSDETDSSYD